MVHKSEWIDISGLPGFVIKFEKAGNVFTVYITDLKNIWSEILPLETFVQRCQECHLIGTEEVLLNQIHNMTTEDTKKNTFEQLQESPETWQLKLRQPIPGSKATAVLNFQMKKLSDEEFYSHLTLPCLTLLNSLTKEKAALIDTIRRKDEEIAEYKACGTINPSRKHVITKPFISKEFEEIHSAQHMPANVFTEPWRALTISSKPLAEISRRMKQLKAVQVKTEVQPGSSKDEQRPDAKVKTENAPTLSKAAKKREPVKVVPRRFPKIQRI